MALVRPHFSCERELSYIYVYAIKPYDILNVKNALVKSVYCVTGYSIFSLVECYTWW